MTGIWAITGLQAQGTTIWDGPIFTYNQPSPDPTQAANQDRLTSNVWLTRAALQGLFNAKTESSYTHFFSPADTAWSYGTLANYASLSYTNWETWNGHNPPSMVGRDAVVHLISDDIYLSLRFTSWGASGGGFAYTRSTPNVVPEPSSALMVLAGLAVAAAKWRRRRSKRFS